ncbi:GyrI-like domain-containing protein [Marinoscillum sp.]|uniref:GyrI-like domain-containing protein n=1 Tax=Marinoscillum sp. TaxID=2024838 RepID=UPI003BAAAA0A
MEMLKIDLSKSDSTYYKAAKSPEIVQLGEYNYLTISGQSSPESPLFLNAIEAIYSVAYGIKFLCKAEDNDFVVPKMECYWFVQGGPENQKRFADTPRDEWMWQIAIRLPDFVEENHFVRSQHQAREKKKELTAIESVKLQKITEGLCAQVLHLGSYEEEEPTIQKLHAYITNQNLVISGYHKEIYLSDPRRVAPEKLRTIIRYQVSRP